MNTTIETSPAATDSSGNESGPEADLEQETKNFKEEAREAASDSFQAARKEGKKLVSRTRENLSNAANDKLNETASKVRNVENAARDAADRLGGSNEALRSGADSLASNISGVADYLEHKQPEEVLDDVRGFVRTHPLATFGALAAAGFLAGRFLKASQPQPEDDPDYMRADVEPHHIPQ